MVLLRILEIAYVLNHFIISIAEIAEFLLSAVFISIATLDFYLQ
jgi:hypothetical protein